MLDWLIDNAQWIFSGIGVAILFGLISAVFKRRSQAPYQEELPIGTAIRDSKSKKARITDLESAGHGAIVEGSEIDTLEINGVRAGRKRRFFFF